jgi:anti-anti-sigma factor
MSQPRAGTYAHTEVREPLPGCIVVSVSGEIDADSAAAFQEQLLAALGAAAERLVVDLAEVTFFDSAGIRCLITLRQRARERATDVRLVLPERAGVRRALDIASLNHLFAVAASVRDALTSPEAA